GAEVANCRQFLQAEIAALPNLRAVLALGVVAHNSILAALGERRAGWPFRHGALHRLPSGLVLADSYHCSRYNTNTGRLTEAMFRDVFSALLPVLRSDPPGAGGRLAVRRRRSFLFTPTCSGSGRLAGR